MKIIRSNSTRDEGFSPCHGVTIRIPGKKQGEMMGKPVEVEDKLYKQLITSDKGSSFPSVFSKLLKEGVFSVVDDVKEVLEEQTPISEDAEVKSEDV